MQTRNLEFREKKKKLSTSRDKNTTYVEHDRFNILKVDSIFF